MDFVMLVGPTGAGRKEFVKSWEAYNNRKVVNYSKDIDIRSIKNSIKFWLSVHYSVCFNAPNLKARDRMSIYKSIKNLQEKYKGTDRAFKMSISTFQTPIGDALCRCDSTIRPKIIKDYKEFEKPTEAEESLWNFAFNEYVTRRVPKWSRDQVKVWDLHTTNTIDFLNTYNSYKNFQEENKK